MSTRKPNDLPTASFYAVPIVLTGTWKASIAEIGNYNYYGLSTLACSPHAMIIGLFPYSSNQPNEYSLIEIRNPKREYVFNKKLNILQPVLIIKEDGWDYLRSDTIYVDVPFEKGIINKILNEELIGEKHLISSIQAPILSAPYVQGSQGGVSLASIAMETTFVKKLNKTIQMMVPPEYRTMQPPKSVYNPNLTSEKIPLRDFQEKTK